MQQTDLLIIGGGAAGLAAAVMAGQQYAGRRILLLEKTSRVGKKLLATGNGTCNISHRGASVENYHGDGQPTVAALLAAFPPERAQVFFRSVGVETVVREDDRIYPLCASAAAVLDCLRIAASAVAELRCDCAALSLHPDASGVTVKTTAGDIRAACVIVAVGGAASPSCGGSADGYRLLTDLGHTRTPLFPSVVQLRADTRYIRAVKGLRVDGTVTIRHNGRPLASQTGEILFTEYGLSGPAVMQISRVVGEWERRQNGRMTAELDLLPDRDDEALLSLLRDRRHHLSATPAEDFLTGLFQRRIGQTVVRMAESIPFDRLAGTLTDAELQRLVNAAKHWTVDLTGTQGFGGAQVTAGGLSMTEFDGSLSSRRYPRIAAIGEVLNVDGDCGGYNLQWAWSSASAAVGAWGGDRL